MTSEDLLKQAQEELYNAIQAIENGDLPFARSSALRAANRIVEAHQNARTNITRPCIQNTIVDPKS